VGELPSFDRYCRKSLEKSRDEIGSTGIPLYENFLLKAAMQRLRTDQRVEDGQHMAAVLHHTREYRKKLRLPLSVFVPLGQNRGRNFDISPQLFGGVSAEEQTVKERGFALREREIRNHFGRQHGSDCRHSKNAVYSKLRPRQVEHWFSCNEAVTGMLPACRTSIQRNGT
jgi:hypothetical protein